MISDDFPTMPLEATRKQAKFIAAYIEHGNATQAIIDAGYAVGEDRDLARKMGSENLSKPVVMEALEKEHKAMLLRSRCNADYILNELYEMAELDNKDILKENGTLKPVKEWPRAWRLNVSALDIQEMAKIGDDEESIQIWLKKIKRPDRKATLELLGKHKAVRAFIEEKSIDHTGLPETLSMTITGGELDPETQAEVDAANGV